jgi:ABC-type nickel/cobalt efflux system permease component RcnA
MWTIFGIIFICIIVFIFGVTLLAAANTKTVTIVMIIFGTLLILGAGGYFIYQMMNKDKTAPEMPPTGGYNGYSDTSD